MLTGSGEHKGEGLNLPINEREKKMEKTIKKPEGNYYLIYSRPEAEPRAVQVEGAFYPADGGEEIDLPEFTYYGEESIQSALDSFIRRAQRTIKENA